MDKRIFMFKEQILANLNKPPSIGEVAKEVNVSVSYLYRLFKSEVGITIVQYIHEQRLEKARKLLEETFSQVNQVGFEVGIRDQSHFVRDFKKKYGLTPTEYRKQHWKILEAENIKANKS